MPECSRKEEQINDIKIMNFESDNAIIDKNIKELRREEFDFLKAKYDKELQDWIGGIDFNMT